jgi:outer membrane protein
MSADASRAMPGSLRGVASASAPVRMSRRRRINSRVVCLAALAFAAPSAAAADTLLDAIRTAYASNPALHVHAAQQRATDERYVQARSGFGPQVSFTGQYGYTGALVDQPASIFAPAATTQFAAATGSADLSMTQSLYSGGRIGGAVEAAGADVLAGRQDLRYAENQLLQDVITAYVDVRRDRQTVEVIRDELAELTKDFEEAQARGKLGELSRTDVAQAGARVLSAQAQLAVARGRLEVSNAEYVNAVGQNPGELAPEPPLVGLPQTPDEAFASAERNNPQLLSAVESERAARDRVEQAKGEYRPNISLKLDAAVAPVEPYLPRQYEKSASAAVVVTVPLFTSGHNASAVREAADQDNAAMSQIAATRRNVVQLAAQAWDQLAAARSAAALQERQAALEATVVEGNRLEEKAGLRTVVDMLNAVQEQTNNKLALLQSRHDAYLAGVAMLAAMGLLEREFQTPDVRPHGGEAPWRQAVARGAETWTGVTTALDELGAPHPPAPTTAADKAEHPQVLQTPEPRPSDQP